MSKSNLNISRILRSNQRRSSSRSRRGRRGRSSGEHTGKHLITFTWATGSVVWGDTDLIRGGGTQTGESMVSKKLFDATTYFSIRRSVELKLVALRLARTTCSKQHDDLGRIMSNFAHKKGWSIRGPCSLSGRFSGSQADVRDRQARGHQTGYDQQPPTGEPAPTHTKPLGGGGGAKRSSRPRTADHYHASSNTSQAHDPPTDRKQHNQHQTPNNNLSPDPEQPFPPPPQPETTIPAGGVSGGGGSPPPSVPANSSGGGFAHQGLHLLPVPGRWMRWRLRATNR